MAPSRFTPETAQRLCELRREGLSTQRCADAVSISRQAVEVWKRRGKEQPTSPYGAFLAAYDASYAAYNRDQANLIEHALRDRFVATMPTIDDAPDIERERSTALPAPGTSVSYG